MHILIKESKKEQQCDNLSLYCGTYKIDDNLLTIINNLFIQVFSHCNDLQECKLVEAATVDRSVPGKRPWALFHKPPIFTRLGACPVYWELTILLCIELEPACIALG